MTSNISKWDIASKKMKKKRMLCVFNGRQNAVGSIYATVVNRVDGMTTLNKQDEKRELPK